MAVGVQRGKHCYNSSIKQEETVEDFSLSRVILRSSDPIRWIRYLEYLQINTQDVSLGWSSCRKDNEK